MKGLVRRFVSFEVGHVLIVKSLPVDHTRDYGVFRPTQVESSKQLPKIIFDAQICFIRPVVDIIHVILPNYKLVASLDA